MSTSEFPRDTDFIRELRDQYSREFELKNRLDQKASSIMTMSGITATLLSGFGTFLLSNMLSNQNIDFTTFILAVILLVSGVVLMTLAIMFSALAYKLTDYRYAYSHDQFLRKRCKSDKADDDNAEFLGENIDKFRKASEANFNIQLIKEYLMSMQQNDERNRNKAKKLRKAQWLFFSGVTTIPAFIIIAVIAVAMIKMIA